ncbi:MAG: hypothetical protein EPO08_00560 [Rhodospirillaceae bacterium]|nr:MAG: hypothetical protein EPO08_00560 [Rhodospirillaceae bacterium]
MARFVKHLALVGLCAVSVAGCAPAYSPNTYSSNAVQLANKVDAGIVVGYREVVISANGSVGAVAGGAAGGVLGGDYGNSALAAIGGTTVGAMVGTAIEHAAGDTTGWEYIVRKLNGDMLSVTQREKKPLDLGQKVLVINGPQARVVPDYSMAPEQPPSASVPKEKAESKPESNVKVEVVLSLPPGASAQSANGQIVAAQSPPVAEATPASAPPIPPVVVAPQASPPAAQSVVSDALHGVDNKPAENSPAASP